MCKTIVILKARVEDTPKVTFKRLSSSKFSAQGFTLQAVSWIDLKIKKKAAKVTRLDFLPIFSQEGVGKKKKKRTN